jgi:hypothetical protein
MSGKEGEKLEGGMVELEAAKIPFATNGLNSPTVYADIIRGANVQTEITKLSLVEHRVDSSDDSIKAVHVAQLVIPTSQIRQWGRFFTRLADQVGLPNPDGE